MKKYEEYLKNISVTMETFLYTGKNTDDFFEWLNEEKTRIYKLSLFSMDVKTSLEVRKPILKDSQTDLDYENFSYYAEVEVEGKDYYLTVFPGDVVIKNPLYSRGRRSTVDHLLCRNFDEFIKNSGGFVKEVVMDFCLSFDDQKPNDQDYVCNDEEKPNDQDYVCNDEEK